VSDPLAIAERGIDAANARIAVARRLAEPAAAEALAGFDRVFGVSTGKAAGETQAALEEAVPGPRWGGGLAVGLEEHAARYTGSSPYLISSHPLPDERSIASARAVREFLADASLTERDAVIACVSGGTSAMLCEPLPPLSLGGVRSATADLMRSGLDVTEVNVVRQAVSALAGGRLADAAWPARCWGLVLVDNVQVGAPAVGSGPTFAPLADPAEVLDLLARAPVAPDTRAALRQAIEAAGKREPRLDRTVNDVVCGPATALDGAARAALERGYAAVTLSDAIQGEAREVAKVLGAIFRYHERERPVCVVGAGEVTVTVPSDCRGRGGRCQELAWAVAKELAGLPRTAFAAVASDGRDYLPDAGGACVAGDTLDRIEATGIDWRARLDGHDTHGGLRAVGALLPSRPTGTNVCDVYVFTAG
jgi:glycerate 2-kinase